MNQINKKTIFWFCSIFCLIAFIFPFFIRADTDTLFSTLSLSLTAVCAAGTISTLIVAIMLYDRFRLDGKFIERQTEKVLELVDLLKGKVITAKGTKARYYIRPSAYHLEGLNELATKYGDLDKKILISYEDYCGSMNRILGIMRSYWLPSSIKEKMGFFEVKFTSDPVASVEGYIKFDYHFDSNKEWCEAMPSQTFFQFMENLRSLIIEIEKFLKEHSNIELDLKLEENNQ